MRQLATPQSRSRGPTAVVESFTATTDFAGNLEYDYLLPPPPGVIGEYGLDILGLPGVLASMTFTDAGPKLDRIWSDAALTNEDYLFAVGDTVYVESDHTQRDPRLQV